MNEVNRVDKEVKGCIHKCDFFNITMDGMECDHPYFNDKGAYDNMIISQKDYGGIPLRCPLRKENLVVECEYRVIV